MAVAKADASSSVRPRSLDMIANQAASAEPVHDDITGSCIKSFEHRHLADDTGRQVGELHKLCRRRPNGFFLHELAPLAQLLTLMAARLERLGGESGDLGPAAAAMILLCTRPFQMKLASDEARFTAERDYDTAKSIVRVEVAAGGEQTVDVTGVRQDDILAQVMRAAGATEEAAEAARAAAAVRMEAYFKPGHVSIARRESGVERGMLPESGVESS